MARLEVHNLKKIYTTRFGGNQVQALSDVSFDLESGGICGRYGRIRLRQDDASEHPRRARQANLRPGPSERPGSHRHPRGLSGRLPPGQSGFCVPGFQPAGHLLLQDNILLPLVLAGVPYGQMQKRLQPLAAQLGLTELLKKFPYEVSGGQKQRAAVARALIKDPLIILADEPTGALDSRSSDELLKLFTRINEGGQTIVVMVTHSVRPPAGPAGSSSSGTGGSSTSSTVGPAPTSSSSSGFLTP